MNRQNRSHGSRLACEREKRTGQDRKKSQKRYNSLICGEAPNEAMYMKICVVRDVLDVFLRLPCCSYDDHYDQRIVRSHTMAIERTITFTITVTVKDTITLKNIVSVGVTITSTTPLQGISFAAVTIVLMVG